MRAEAALRRLGVTPARRRVEGLRDDGAIEPALRRRARARRGDNRECPVGHDHAELSEQRAAISHRLVDRVHPIAREKVHPAAVGLELLARLRPELKQSGAGASGLGVPLVEGWGATNGKVDRLGRSVPKQEEEHIA